MIKKRRVAAVILMVIGAIVAAKGVNAEVTKEALVEKVGFTYKIEHPENQLGDGGALNLKMTRKQFQEVTVVINNLGSAELTLLLSINGARTNPNGGLEYGPSLFKKDQSMQVDLPELIKIPQELTIPANSTANLILGIQMPEIAFGGIVTGGIQMIEKDQEEEESQGTTIVNKIAYLFGVTLQMLDEEVKPELQLNKAYPGQANYRNSIFLDIANIEPMILRGLMLEAKITKKDKKDLLFESKKNNMEMAPNTIMSYPISLSGEAMSAGNYTAHVTAKAQGKEWKWQNNFTITTEQADKFNQEDVSLVQDRGLNWQLIVLIFGGGLLVLAISYLGIKAVNKKSDTRKRKPKS